MVEKTIIENEHYALRAYTQPQVTLVVEFKNLAGADILLVLSTIMKKIGHETAYKTLHVRILKTSEIPIALGVTAMMCVPDLGEHAVFGGFTLVVESSLWDSPQVLSDPKSIFVPLGNVSITEKRSNHTSEFSFEDGTCTYTDVREIHSEHTAKITVSNELQHLKQFVRLVVGLATNGVKIFIGGLQITKGGQTLTCGMCSHKLHDQDH